MPHPELSHVGKSLKQFYITTGLGLAFIDDFEIQIFNVQKPTKESVLADYTQEYFMKVINQRKLN
jgi:hypothetical protein